MFRSSTQIRVRYAETDKMGYVYYGNYCTYYEIARAETIRQLGYTYNEMEQEGILMPVVKLNVKFIQPAFYDNVLIIETFIKEIPISPFITFYHKIMNEKKQLLNIAQVTLAFYNPIEKRKVACPEKLLNIFKQHFT